MKKKQLILTVALTLSLTIIILFPSCQKKYCWKCAMTTYTRTSPAGSINTGYTSDTTVNHFSVCDQTASGIKAYEKSTSSIQTQGNIIVSTVSTTTCNQ